MPQRYNASNCKHGTSYALCRILFLQRTCMLVPRANYVNRSLLTHGVVKEHAKRTCMQSFETISNLKLSEILSLWNGQILRIYRLNDVIEWSRHCKWYFAMAYGTPQTIIFKTWGRSSLYLEKCGIYTTITLSCPRGQAQSLHGYSWRVRNILPRKIVWEWKWNQSLSIQIFPRSLKLFFKASRTQLTRLAVS